MTQPVTTPEFIEIYDETRVELLDVGEVELVEVAVIGYDSGAGGGTGGGTGGDPVTFAYVDDGDTASRDRANHTGTQAASTITGLSAVATSGSYNDLTQKPVPYTDQDVYDVLAQALLGGSNVTITPNPTTQTVTIEATSAGGGTYTDEQVRDVVGAALVAGSGITVSVNDALDTITISANIGGGGGTSTTGDFGRVSFDSFAGSTDDAKLTAALSGIAADTYPRAIQYSNRRHDFATMGRIPFEGMRHIGPEGFSNPERNGQTKMAARFHLSGTGAWFAPTSEVFQTSFRNMAFTGGSGAWVIGGTANWYCLSMRDIYSSGLRSVVGSQAQAAILTACTFDGAWEINNCYDGAFHLRGSDNTFWPNGMLLDSGTAFVGSGQAHVWCDSLDKSTIGPLYITAESDWCAIRHDGAAFGSSSTNQGLVFYQGMRVEGRNPGASSYGSLFRQSGGIAIIRDSWFGYGMSNPTAVGHSAGDGVIHQVGGQLRVEDCVYDRATGVAETVPFVKTNSPGACIVRGIAIASRGGSWTGNPRVAKPTANAENRITDSTVTLVSV